MHAIILAGGYAMRLRPLTTHIPKALLPVDGKPIIDFLVEKILDAPEIDRIVVSTNARFANHFRYWQQNMAPRCDRPLRIAVEPTRREEEKLGAIGALAQVIGEEDLGGSELLVIAGDNLFEFSLTDLLAFYRSREGLPVAAFCDLETPLALQGKYGAALLDQDGRVTEFQEKSMDPCSSLASTGCYVFPETIEAHIAEYLADPAHSRDAPGYFIDWLRRKTGLAGFVFREAWYDIGSFESYDQVNEDYRGRVRLEGGGPDG